LGSYAEETVLPRLLYGLEILPLSKTHLDMLNKFHMKNLSNFQSLPSRTTKGATLLLIGDLPLEAEINRRPLLPTRRISKIFFSADFWLKC
jgi:hypothetical protein